MAVVNAKMEQVPCDYSAEEAILGGLLIDSELIFDVKPVLKPDDFWDQKNMKIYQAICDICDRGEVVNQITVARQLADKNELNGIGGAARTSELIEKCFAPSLTDSFVRVVKNKAYQRATISIGHRIMELGKKEPDPSVIASAMDKMYVELQEGIAVPRLITPRELAKLGVDRYSSLAKGKALGLKTGFYDLDYATGGYYGGELIILGARPGLGKTSLLLNMAQNMGEAGKKGLLCSLEQRWKEILDRLMGSYINKSPLYLREGGYSEDMANSIMYHLEDVDKSNVYLYDSNGIVDTGGATTASIYSVANHMKQGYGLDYIMVDYLGLVDDRSGDKQYERISEITRKFKRIAMNLDVPVIVACQLNRQLEKQDDKRPQLADLRDSGSIEQDADGVIFLYRDDYYRDKRDNGCQVGIAQLILAKQRQGGGSEVTVDLRWDSVKRIYTNLAKGV